MRARQTEKWSQSNSYSNNNNGKLFIVYYTETTFLIAFKLFGRHLVATVVVIDFAQC